MRLQQLTIVATSALLACLLALSSCQSTPAAESQDSYFKADDGILLHYRILGSGPEVLVVPGESWMTDGLERLAKTHRVIAYDLRGRGRSDASFKASLKQDIADLETACRALKLERFSLLGFDYQGAVAALFAAQHPERVEQLVIVSPLPIAKDPYWTIYRRIYEDREAAGGAYVELEVKRAEGLPRTDPAAWSKAYRNTVLAGWVEKRSSLSRMKANPFGNHNPDEMVLQYFDLLRKLGDWDWREDLGAISIPTLIVLGSSDPVPSESNAQWQGAIPGAEGAIIQRSGRLPWLERSSEFHEVVAEFLE